jgi:hypothetical protein
VQSHQQHTWRTTHTYPTYVWLTARMMPPCRSLARDVEALAMRVARELVHDGDLDHGSS